MKPPSSIKVGYAEFAVRPFSLDLDADGGMYGRFSRASCLIEYHPRQHREHELDTLLHEVLHACWAQAALNDEDDEERIITGLSNTLTQVLKDNPEFLKWIRSVV